MASGALDFEDAVALVAKRGEYMEEAAPADSGKMVAVLNTPVEVIEEACHKKLQLGVVTPAITITHLQIVSLLEVVLLLIACVHFCKTQAKRLIPFIMSGPFHTALLEPASLKN